MSGDHETESTSDAAPVAAAAPPRRARYVRTALVSLCVAVAAALIVTARFAPRFALWHGLAIAGDLPQPTAEFDRATTALTQLDDPWAPVNRPFHTVLGWRLLFPVVGHYLRLPPNVYLALPHVGCLLALWLTAALTYRRLGHWCMTLVATTIVAALPWFFVSCGWLAHFDSWLLVGLLATAFVPSRRALAAACLLAPWVDERFILALPATVAVRAFALDQIDGRAWREMLTDLILITVATLPYLAIRGVGWLVGDPNSASYVRAHWAELPTVPLVRFLFGLWSGYRVAWLVILVGLILAGRRVPGRYAAALAIIELGTAMGGLFIAWDMSRSVMMIVPMLVLAMWLWEEWRVQDNGTEAPSATDVESNTVNRVPLLRRSQKFALALFLPAVLVANLIAPAHHVLWSNYWPVETFSKEIHKWRYPPSLFQAVEYVREGRSLKEQGRLDDALAKYDDAVKTDENYAIALVERAVLRMQLGMLQGAEADAGRALHVLPDYPFAFLLRGVLRNARGDRTGAVVDLRHALEIAPPDWEFRQEATQRLSEIMQQPPAS